MSVLSSTLATIAIIPILAGPIAHSDHSRSLTIAMCEGGEINIPIDSDKDPAHDCDFKACHAGTCRQKSKTIALPVR